MFDLINQVYKISFTREPLKAACGDKYGTSQTAKATQYVIWLVNWAKTKQATVRLVCVVHAGENSTGQKTKIEKRQRKIQANKTWIPRQFVNSSVSYGVVYRDTNFLCKEVPRDRYPTTPLNAWVAERIGISPVRRITWVWISLQALSDGYLFHYRDNWCNMFCIIRTSSSYQIMERGSLKRHRNRYRMVMANWRSCNINIYLS